MKFRTGRFFYQGWCNSASTLTPHSQPLKKLTVGSALDPATSARAKKVKVSALFLIFVVVAAERERARGRKGGREGGREKKRCQS